MSFEPLPPNKMRVVTPLWVDVSALPGITHQIRIPADYAFDGASIPRPIWSLIGAPFEPDFILASCVHDWYCERSIEGGDYLSRVIGDGVFFALLNRAGVPAWKCVAMYLAVRLHSWWLYGRKHASGTVAVQTLTPPETPVPERGTRADWFEDAD